MQQQLQLSGTLPIDTTSATYSISQRFVHSIPVYRPKHTFDLKNSNFSYAGLQENFNYKPEKSFFYSTFARQLCNDQDGSRPFQHSHKHSGPLRQALHTQIANHHIQQARKSLSVEGKFCPAMHMKVPPAHYKGLQATSKGHVSLVESYRNTCNCGQKLIYRNGRCLLAMNCRLRRSMARESLVKL